MKTRASTVAGLLENYETINEVIKSAENAEGSALEENQRYIQSIQGHLDQLTNKWQELWSNTTNRETINWFIDLGKTILDVVDNIGLLKTALIGIGAGIGIRQSLKGGGRHNLEIETCVPQKNMPPNRLAERCASPGVH